MLAQSLMTDRKMGAIERALVKWIAREFDQWRVSGWSFEISHFDDSNRRRLARCAAGEYELPGFGYRAKRVEQHEIETVGAFLDELNGDFRREMRSGPTRCEPAVPMTVFGTIQSDLWAEIFKGQTQILRACRSMDLLVNHSDEISDLIERLREGYLDRFPRL